MTSFNYEDILISFEELKELQIEDISMWVDKYNALNICENSSASPCETYNLWVQKLFKAYDLKQFSSDDWQKIVEYLENVLNNFVQNVNSLDDTSLQQLNLWWLDTQELLQWLESVVSSLDVCILSLILTFALEVIIKTYKFVNQGNIQPILTIQKLIIGMLNNCMIPLPIEDVNGIEGFNKVLSSLCDVGSLISSADIKISIDTWRMVAKLSDHFNNLNLSNIQTENTINSQCDWLKKAIFGILKELMKILRSFLNEENTSSYNDNILQVSQFYLKLLKVFTNHSADKIEEFPAMNEYLELYTLCNHQLSKRNKSQIDLFVNKGLYEIFSLIYHQPKIRMSILHHLKQDITDFRTCDLILNYLKLNIENYQRIEPGIEELINIYDVLFEGPLIFIDNDKYSKIVEYYVAFTIQDNTSEMHKKLCDYVLNSSWIKAFASAEVLKLYYSFLLKSPRFENNLHCLEYWLKIWNKCNNSIKPLPTQIMLIELLLKTIIQKIPDSILYQKYSKLDNFDMIMLKCGKENSRSLEYLQTNLRKHLHKMKEYQIDNNDYREMVNLLDLCSSKTFCLDYSLKEILVETFMAVFVIAPLEIPKFGDFFKKCFKIFIHLKDKPIHDKVLKILLDNLSHTVNIWSIFLLEYLLQQRPQSTQLLQTLKCLELRKVLNLMDGKLLTIDKKPIDLNIFQNLNFHHTNNFSNNNDIKQISKKPRLGESKFSNIKFVLNELNLHSQNLLKFDPKLMDNKDVELLNCIKNNIEICLRK